MHTLSQIQESFLERLKLLTFFREHHELTVSTFDFLEEKRGLDTSRLQDFVNEYKRLNQEIEQRNKSVRTLLLEKVFLDTYAAFEVLLSDHFTYHYLNFPKSCMKKAKGTLSVNFSDIFESDDIEITKNNIVGDMVKGIIQKNSLSDSIHELLSTVQIQKNKHDEVFSPQERKNLFRVQAIRNLITHNHGKMNNFTLKLLAKYNVNHPFTIDYDVTENLDEELGIADALFQHLAEKIQVAILRQQRTLEAHESSI